MREQEEFAQIYQELKAFYDNSGDLASALLPFIDKAKDFKVAAQMLHTQLQVFHNIRG